MDTYVNPGKGMRINQWISFDFPLPTQPGEYSPNTPGSPLCCLPNLDLGVNPNPTSEVPAHEGVLGQLGAPLRHQGFPRMREHYPEPMGQDPWVHDQILDIDRRAMICHTGRLSGTFVKNLVQASRSSVVTMYAVPITVAGGPVEMYNKKVALVPAGKGCNVWFWENPNRAELIYVASLIVQPADWTAWGMQPGIYKLVIDWTFEETDPNGVIATMPISGYDSSIDFKLSRATLP
jgi:hypothetical protein